MESLCFLIPRIDAWDFSQLRDGKTELRHLRNKVLGIPKDCIVSMEEINAKVADYERSLKMQKPEFRDEELNKLY